MLIELKNKKKINVEIIGEGTPIIFVHSYLWDLNMWEPQLKEFSKKYKCIGIDLWGHGKSEPLDKIENYSLEELSEDIIEITEKLNIDKFIYVGLSVGAMLGGYLGLNHGNKILKMVLMDGYSGDEPNCTKGKYFYMLDTIEKIKMIPEEMADIITPMFFSKKENEEKGTLYKTFKNELLNKKAENIDTIVALGRGIFGRENILNRLENIKVPTMFMVGEEDIPRPVYESEEMGKLVKDSKVVIIPKGGHISNLENAEFVNTKIEEFIGE
ncbi:alpha/beta fold hydrolase [Cetobacterium ceti]